MKTPKYRRHANRDRAFVEFAGRRYYLPGSFNSVESRDAYKDFLRTRVFADSAPPPTPVNSGGQLALVKLVSSYLVYAKSHYPPGKRSEFTNVKIATMNLANTFPDALAAQFGPKMLKKFQATLADTGRSRKYINGQVSRIKRMFRWGVSEELVPASVHQSLTSVDGLRAGRTKARETEPRQPVACEHVEAVLPFVSPVVAGMARFQWLTGARSDSVCQAKLEQFDRSGDVWFWRPHHKGKHLGHQLIIPVGPRGQAVLKPFIEAAESPDAYLFSPRTIRKNRRYRQHYIAGSYCTAIQRGIARAKEKRIKVERWTPHQIRHSRGTIVRDGYGLEAAQAALGHLTMDATQIYAQKQLRLAVTVAREIG